MEWIIVYFLAGLLWSAINHKPGTKWHQHVFIAVAWGPLFILNIVGWIVRKLNG